MLSKSTEYAIRALVFVRIRNLESGRPGVTEIAREIEAPVPYSAKILHTLTKHGLLHSMKGRGGGFFFDGDRQAPTLYEVINVMEGDARFNDCAFGLKYCNEENPCPLHEHYAKLRDGFFDTMKSETIETLSQKILDGNAVLNHL